MSRSNRAWTESSAPVSYAMGGANGRGGRKDDSHLPGVDPTGPASLAKYLVTIVTATLLIIAVSPPLALGRPASPAHGRLARGQPPRATPVLALGSGYAGPTGAPRVRVLQRRLADLGFAPGPIDGRYGPLTDHAVTEFQRAQGLVIDGIAGPQCIAAATAAQPLLYPGVGYGQRQGSAIVRALQRNLAHLGLHPGRIDGLYGPLTTTAVERFQRVHRVAVDGIVGPQTWPALRQATNRPSVSRPPQPSAPESPPAPKSRPCWSEPCPSFGGSMLSLVTMQWTFRYTPAYTTALSLVVNGAPVGTSLLMACRGRGCPFAKRLTVINGANRCARDGRDGGGCGCAADGQGECGCSADAQAGCGCSADVQGGCQPAVELELARYFWKHRLGVGTRFTIAITRPQWIGKYYMFETRAGRAPRVHVACLTPGGTQPGAAC